MNKQALWDLSKAELVDLVAQEVKLAAHENEQKYNAQRTAVAQKQRADILEKMWEDRTKEALDWQEYALYLKGRLAEAGVAEDPNGLPQQMDAFIKEEPQ